MLTGKSYLWIALGLALGLLGVASRAPALAVTGAGLFIHVCYAWAMAGRTRLTGSVDLARAQVTEGDAVGVEVTLRNPSTRTVLAEFALELPAAFTDDAASAHGSVAVRPGQEVHVEASVVPVLHGTYGVGPLHILLRDPGGLVVREVSLATPQRVVAFPRTDPIRDAPLRSKRVTPFLGRYEVQQPGDGFEFYTLRGYQAGDSIRRINWRASARSKDLIVNQRVRESLTQITIFVDGRAWEGAGVLGHAPWYRSARAAASLAEAYMGTRDQVTVHVLTDKLHTVRAEAAERQRRELLDTFSSIRPHGSGSLATCVREMLPQIKPRSLFVLVSSLESETGLADVIRQVRGREIPVLIVTPGTVWPDGQDAEVPAMVSEAKQRRRAELKALRAADARVLDWEPDQLLGLQLQEVALA